jgi:hypothetical protein
MKGRAGEARAIRTAKQTDVLRRSTRGAGKPTRREFLRTGVALSVCVAAAGCAGDGGSGTAGETEEPTDSAATPSGSTTTATATPSGRFERYTSGSFPGEVTLESDPLVRVTIEGALGSPGNHPRAGIIRTSPIEPPFEVTFAGVSFERSSVENGINIGLSAFRSQLFLAEGQTPYVSVRSEDGRSDPTKFVLEFGAEGSSVTVATEPFSVTGDDTDITLVHTGERIRLLVDGTEVSNREYGLSESFFPAVTLEDDPETEQGGSLTVTSYTENDS